MPLERTNGAGEDARRISRVAVGPDRLVRIVSATVIVAQRVVARPYGTRCMERGGLWDAICAQLFLFVVNRRRQEVYKLRCMAAGRRCAYSSTSLGVMLFAEGNLRKDQERWGQLPFRCR